MLLIIPAQTDPRPAQPCCRNVPRTVLQLCLGHGNISCKLSGTYEVSIARERILNCCIKALFLCRFKLHLNEH